MRKYSRLVNVQEKKHRRQTVLWVFLSLVLIGILLVWGIPTLVNMTAFLADFKGGKIVTKGDTIAPAPPIFTTPEIATNNANLKITGTAESQTKLILTHNDLAEELNVNESGFFEKEVKLFEGDNTFSAKTKDAAGNESEASRTLTIKYDITPPEIAITEPQNNQQFGGRQAQNITIKGSTSEETTVTINGRLATELQNNNFSTTIKLQEGINELIIEATDTAGNKTQEKLNVTFYF